VKGILILLLVPGVVLSQAVGSVRGVVHDSLGGVVSSAHVSISGIGIPTRSDSAGAFRLWGIPPGSAVLDVRRLGYRPTSIPVTITAGSELSVDIDLVPVPEQLEPVQVRRRAEVYDSRLAGFNERKLKHVGYFVTRERLDRMSSARFVDALREMPGVSMRTLRGGVVTVSIRGARCAPIFYMDGFPATSGPMDLDMIDLSGVEGIEVYGGMSSIPAEFMSVVGGESCGVIAVWSRPTRPRKQRIEQASDVDLENLLASRAVYTSDQVDDPARLTSGSATPIYPDSLWNAGVAGRVVAEFIVDPEGLIEPGSVRIVSATHAYFASAVAGALATTVFRAAVLGGKPVRQVVQLPFVFSLNARDTIPHSHN
jgi:Carboxypeptidase regulatory-like domain/TonB-dependent Receptor Plug Domain/Gram-negative bacterial TonB protein C-terminal